MVEFSLVQAALAVVGGFAGGAFSPWFNARIEKARKRRELFEPIYDNFSVVTKHGLRRDNAKRWDRMSASSQLLVPPKVEEKLNRYSEMCSEFQTEYGLLFHSRGEFDSAFPDDLYQPGGSSGGPRISASTFPTVE